MNERPMVLLVEDEQELRWICTRFLEKHFGKVLGARNGVEGLRVYAKYREQIAAIITDQDMPIMDGATMLAHIREIDPNVKALVVGSDGRDRPADVEYLQKPFDLDELLQKVRPLCEITN